MEDTQVLPKLTSFREAIQCLEEVRCFLQSRGGTSEAISTGKMIDSLVFRVPSATQTTLHNYYPACQYYNDYSWLLAIQKHTCTLHMSFKTEYILYFVSLVQTSPQRTPLFKRKNIGYKCVRYLEVLLYPVVLPLSAVWLQEAVFACQVITVLPP